MDDFRQFTEEMEKLTNKKFEELDTDFIVDWLLEMSNDFKDTVVKWLGTNIYHRLKLMYCSNVNPKLGWRRTVNRTIRDLELKFKRNPSLRKWLEDNFDEAWNYAVNEYEDSVYEWDDLPELDLDACPWTFDELLKKI